MNAHSDKQGFHPCLNMMNIAPKVIFNPDTHQAAQYWMRDVTDTASLIVWHRFCQLCSDSVVVTVIQLGRQCNSMSGATVMGFVNQTIYGVSSNGKRTLNSGMQEVQYH